MASLTTPHFWIDEGYEWKFDLLWYLTCNTSSDFGESSLLLIICLIKVSWLESKFSNSINEGWFVHPCIEETKGIKSFPNPRLRQHRNRASLTVSSASNSEISEHSFFTFRKYSLEKLPWVTHLVHSLEIAIELYFNCILISKQLLKCFPNLLWWL